MKRLCTGLALASTLLFSIATQAQNDASKRPSPPAKVSEKIQSGANVTIDYSQPGVKGRTIGKDLEPMSGKVWRTGANHSTVFEVDKDVTIQGQTLPAGKYSLFSLSGENEWTIIFSKNWDQMGAFNYKESEDALRVKAPATKGTFTERMTFNVAKDGTVSLLWGDHVVTFKVA